MSMETHHFKSSVQPGEDLQPYPPPPPYEGPHSSQYHGQQYQQSYPYYHNGASAYPPGAVIMTTQPQCDRRITVIQQAPPFRPPDYLILAIFVTCCCNLLLGLIAIVFSAMSNSDYKDGNIDGARSKGKVSLGLSIAGIVLTVVIVAFAVIYVTAIATKTAQAVCLYGLCY